MNKAAAGVGVDRSPHRGAGSLHDTWLPGPPQLLHLLTASADVAFLDSPSSWVVCGVMSYAISQ